MPLSKEKNKIRMRVARGSCCANCAFVGAGEDPWGLRCRLSGVVVHPETPSCKKRRQRPESMPKVAQVHKLTFA